MGYHQTRNAITQLDVYRGSLRSTALHFHIWVNGDEVTDLHRTDWQQDALGSFQIGFEKYAGPDAELWYDDIAVSAQPIGCD